MEKKGQALEGLLFPAKAISAGLDRDHQGRSGNAILTGVLGLRTVREFSRRSPDDDRSLSTDQSFGGALIPLRVALCAPRVLVARRAARP